MKYRDGYLYQAAEDEIYQTRYRPIENIEAEFITLFTDGKMILKSGYACDGPSGPPKYLSQILPEWLRRKYLKKIMRGAFGHDGKYQLIRMELLNESAVAHLEMDVRKVADIELREDLITDGMNRVRASMVYYKAVRIGGKSLADPENKKKIHEAP